MDDPRGRRHAEDFCFHFKPMIAIIIYPFAIVIVCTSMVDLEWNNFLAVYHIAINFCVSLQDPKSKLVFINQIE